MKAWNRICKKLLLPPGWVMAILAGFSAAALPVVFLRGADEHPAAYAVYALSAYALTVVCIFLVRTLPGFYRAARQKLYANPWGKRFMTDAAFRVWMSLLVSLGMNLVYSAFKLTVGIVYSSFWWGAVAVYYIVLSMIRFLLLCQMRSMRSQQDIMSEYRRYRLCGAMLVLLNLSLTGLVVQMVRDHRAYVYPESMVIASAAYTFYTVAASILDMVKYRAYKSPTLSAAKIIRFAAALVSLLSLETAMLAQYGGGEGFRRSMTGLTGGGVCVMVLAMSVYMILKANRELKKYTQEACVGKQQERQNMENKNEAFHYTYSAREQEEVRRIRQKYTPKERDRLEQLRRLDQRVSRKSAAVSLTAGILGTLLLGLGMCATMVWMGPWFIPGIVIGLVGIALVALAYPLHTRIAKQEREKVAPEILRLADDLMK